MGLHCKIRQWQNTQMQIEFYSRFGRQNMEFIELYLQYS